MPLPIPSLSQPPTIDRETCSPSAPPHPPTSPTSSPSSANSPRYEREPDAVLATEADLLRDGFTADESKAPRRFHSLIAEWHGQPAGFALYFYSYSTWEGRAGIYLEDLFVRPEFRGKGIGKALLTKVAAIAVAEGCGRFEWSVLDWNQPSIDFYHQMGAVMKSEWLGMRVSGDALAALAAMSN